MNFLDFTTKNLAPRDVSLTWAEDAYVVGEVELRDETYMVYRTDDPSFSFECGVDQGFHHNGACPDTHELGIKVYKRGFPIRELPDCTWTTSGYDSSYMTHDWAMSRLREGLDESREAFDRQELAADCGLAPHLGRKIIVLKQTHVYRNTDVATGVTNKMMTITNTKTGVTKQVNSYTTIREEDLAEGWTIAHSTFDWTYHKEAQLEWCAFVGFETGVADTSFSYQFPVQDEDDPYGCMEDINQEFRSFQRVILSAYENLLDEGGESEDEDFVENHIDNMWEVAEDRCRKHSSFPLCEMDAILWEFIVSNYTLDEMGSDDWVEWDVYEMIGRLYVDHTGDTVEESLTGDLIQIGMGGDLHTGNVGWFQDRWVCIDFSDHCIR